MRPSRPVVRPRPAFQARAVPGRERTPLVAEVSSGTAFQERDYEKPIGLEAGCGAVLPPADILSLRKHHMLPKCDTPARSADAARNFHKSDTFALSGQMLAEAAADGRCV